MGIDFGLFNLVVLGMAVWWIVGAIGKAGARMAAKGAAKAEAREEEQLSEMMKEARGVWISVNRDNQRAAQILQKRHRWKNSLFAEHLVEHVDDRIEYKRCVLRVGR